MKTLVTGGTGFVGHALIPRLLAKGDEVIALTRDIEKAKSLLPKEVRIVEGDVLHPNLGLEETSKDIQAVYHLVAIHRLDESKSADIWETNVLGTEHVLRFCEEHDVLHIYFTSTAYTFARNSYEKSKMLCESMVLNSKVPRKTIFKPSVIMPSEGIAYLGHFLQVVLLMVKLHKRAELIRRYVEGKLRLPILRPVFRVPGNPDGTLNLVKLDDVVRAMAEIEDEGVFWLTNPSPPRLLDLTRWVGEYILLDFRLEPMFNPTPIELAFQKVGAAFMPYVWGDNFNSDIEAEPISKQFVHSTIKTALLA